MLRGAWVARPGRPARGPADAVFRGWIGAGVGASRWFALALGFALAGIAGGAEPDVFSRDRLHEVRVTLPAAEWDALRGEHPDFVAQLGPSRTNGRPARAYQNHRGTVEIDGTVVADVAVRKKGFIGSVSRTRPSLNFEAGVYAEGRKIAGLAKLTANNNQQDPSAIRQCLAYDLFRAAGIAAPRASLARVVVNGADLGIYTLVEPVDRRFVAREFGPDGGGLWEGTLTDFRPEWLRMFEAKSGTRKSAGRVLGEVAAVLARTNGPPDLEDLGRLVDLDRFVSFWAAEVLVDHWDGYANNLNNYFVHRRGSDGRLVFVPWGADSCLGARGAFVPPGAPASVRATGFLPRRLYADAAWRERYRARLRALLDTAWKEDAIAGEISRLDALVGTNVWVGSAGRKAAVRRTRDFVRGRRKALLRELDAPAREWTAPPRALAVLTEWGRLTASFSTTYRRSFPVNWFTNGTVDLRIELDGAARPFVQAGVASGPGFDARQTNDVWVTLVAMRGIGGVQVPAVSVPRSRFVAGGDARVGFFDGSAFLFEGIPTGPADGGFGFLDGTLHLDEAGTAEGAAVKGRLEATVWKWNFKP